MGSDEDAIIQRLDTIIQLLKLGFAEKLAEVRSQFTEDATQAVLLERCAGEWTSAGDLQKVAARTGVSERTVRNRLAELVEAGLVERRGSGPATEYRTSGLI